MIYTVEIGHLEVIAYLVRKGNRKNGSRPKFNLDAGMDWDGYHHVLTEDEERKVIQWIEKNYASEVWA